MIKDNHTSENALSSDTGSATLRPEDMQKRIHDLPAFDILGRINGITALFLQVNAQAYSAKNRSALTALLQNELKGILDAYREKLWHYSFPLAEKPRELSSALQKLLAETVTAYKKLIQDLIKAHGEKIPTALLQNAILFSVDTLSQIIMLSYATYQPAPEGTWKDLHRLYAYSEQKKIGDTPPSGTAELSINAAYARALLLGLSNPFHLMKGEIFDTYEHLKTWGKLVKFEHLPKTDAGAAATLILDRFFCDLAEDSPPDYGIKDRAQTPKITRLLDLDTLLSTLDARIASLNNSSGQTLVLKLEENLLPRLRMAWEKRRTRKSDRLPEKGTLVKAVVGLTGCHSFYSGYADFEPEEFELSTHEELTQQPQTPELSLMSLDDTPWLEDSIHSGLSSGAIKPRSLAFDTENSGRGIWEEANMIDGQQQTSIEKDSVERTLSASHQFKLINRSKGGEGLETLPKSTVKLHVGEILAAFPHSDDTLDDPDPVIHIVCWIRSNESGNLHFGIRQIYGESDPVAIRNIDEHSLCKSYEKGFLLIDNKQLVSLITPAGQFEVGNQVVVNDGNKIRLLKLDSLIEHTRSICRYKVSLIESNSDNSRQAMNSLKALLSRK